MSSLIPYRLHNKNKEIVYVEGPNKILASKIRSHLQQEVKRLKFLYKEPSRSNVLDLMHRIRKETDILFDIPEMYHIYMAVKETKKISGDIAEVGVYKGGSARIISHAKGDKTLHLFDTFEGLPAPSHEKDNYGKYPQGRFISAYDEVKSSLSSYPHVYIYKGLFPETANPIRDKKFSFVHLDVDIYQSTIQCLEFFYPRMNPGGIIISHDYLTAKGVKMAFEEFFDKKPEPIIELSARQCLVVKV